jgi:hypothetical protein
VGIAFGLDAASETDSILSAASLSRAPSGTVIVLPTSVSPGEDAVASLDPKRDAHLLEVTRVFAKWAAVQKELYFIARTVPRMPSGARKSHPVIKVNLAAFQAGHCACPGSG